MTKGGGQPGRGQGQGRGQGSGCRGQVSGGMRMHGWRCLGSNDQPSIVDPALSPPSRATAEAAYKRVFEQISASALWTHD